jgi:hypothetical protein
MTLSKLILRTVKSSFLTLSILISSVANGDATDGTNTVKSSKGIFSKDKWSASVDSMHYNFSGEQAARGNIYSFENVTTDIQMVSLNYKYSPTLTFSLVTQYVNIYAETFFGPTLYFDRTHGLGDTLVKATKTNFINNFFLVTDFAVSLPTGSISEKNENAPQFNYPYNMQLGSGTLDFILTQTAIKNLSAKHQVGAFAQGRLRTGLSDEGYRRGNEVAARLWYSYILSPNIMPGIWANYYLQQGIQGEDRTFGRNVFVEFYHNSRQFWDITPHVNLNYDINKNFKLRAMVGVPVWQISENIDDIQLFTRWFTQVGIDARF